MMSLSMGAASGMEAGKAMATYLLEQQETDKAMSAAAYYGQDAAPTLRADIDPELAEALGLKPGQVITADVLAPLLAGRRADGALLPGQHQHQGVETYGEDAARHRVAYLDLTLSAPKHLSVAWAFAEKAEERDALLQAHRAARDETLRYVEQFLIRGRLGHGGRDGNEPGKAAWVTVDHFTARPTKEVVKTDPVTGEVYTKLESERVAGDPHVHSHCLIPNLIRTESGRFVAIDTAAFHGQIHHFGAVYQAILARELNRMGIRADIDPRTNMARIHAIPERVVKEFSKRTRDAERAAHDKQDFEALTPEQQVAAMKVGAHSTRQPKATNSPDLQAWREQAERIRWKHTTAVSAAVERSRADRMNHADRVGLEHLSEMLTKKAVLNQGDVRLAAARGFIASGGLGSTDELGLMMRHWAKAGVMQDGRMTALVWKETEHGKIRLTTELHADQEAELIGLAQKAARDLRHALPLAAISAAVDRSGVSYKGAHGDAQREAVDTIGTDGALSVVVGVAGSGKSTGILKPLVNAWQREGLEVWGTAQAWRQAKALRDTGIINTRALDPFLAAVAGGKIAVGRNSVVVLDEVGRIGTRQLLLLLRLQEQHGFKLVALGDDKQTVAIEAGPVVDLLRRALGAERIPEVLTTIRQEKEREQEIAAMFRNGQVAEAMAEKRRDGTAELVPGGYREAIDRVADLYMERRAATVDRSGYVVSVSAPTNHDAHEIGHAIRLRRRALGELGPDMASVPTTDGHGSAQRMDLAAGDKVRLYAQTRGVFAADRNNRPAIVGDNGSVLDVVSVDRREGLHLRGESGKVAFVPWSALKDKKTGRFLLGTGEVLTTDTSQGITSDEHIDAQPGGSSMVARGKAYVGASRHRIRHHFVGSMGAEMKEARSRRMTGLPEMSSDALVEEAWRNLVRNLNRATVKDSALAFMDLQEVTKALTANPTAAKALDPIEPPDPKIMAAAWAVATGDKTFTEATTPLIRDYLDKMSSDSDWAEFDAHVEKIELRVSEIASAIQYVWDVRAEQAQTPKSRAAATASA